MSEGKIVLKVSKYCQNFFKKLSFGGVLWSEKLSNGFDSSICCQYYTIKTVREKVSAIKGQQLPKNC